MYFEVFRPKIISDSEGKYAVLCQKKDGEKELFLIKNNDFSMLPPNSIGFLTLVGHEESYKQERLKR